MIQAKEKSQVESPKLKKIEQYIFRYEDKIGEGRFSQVYKGIDQSLNMTVAVKVIQLSSLKSKTAQELLHNEIAILKDLSHPNVIKCLDVITSINNCYIVCQMCDQGDLERLLQKKGKFREEQIARIVYDLYKGLLYLSNENIVHRDLKIANVFIAKDGQAKIADFGFAAKAKSYFKDISIGSPIYMSPEGLVSQIYSPKTDVWSFGVLIYELIHGQPPLAHCKTEQELKQQSLLEPNISFEVSVQLREFIKLCLTQYPQQRPNVKDLYSTPYMKKVFERMGDFQIPKTLVETWRTMDSTTVSKSSTVMDVQSSETELQENKEDVRLFKDLLNYDEAVALVHYCRLIYKTCKINQSKVLIEWLLLISYSLQRTSVNQKHTQAMKLKEVIRQYHQKYKTEYSQLIDAKKCCITIQDAILECKTIKKCSSHAKIGPGTPTTQKSVSNFTSHTCANFTISPKSRNHILMLLKETEELKRGIKTGRLSQFAKNSQIDAYLKKQG